MDQALEKYHSVIKMGQLYSSQGAVIEFLVGIAIEQLPVCQFKSFLAEGDLSEEQILFIKNALEEIEHDMSGDTKRFIQHDKIMAKSFLMVFYEVNENGKIRLSRNPDAAIDEAMGKFMDEEELHRRQTSDAYVYWRRKASKAKAILFWFSIPSTPVKVLEVIDEAYVKIETDAELGHEGTRRAKTFIEFVKDLFSWKAQLNYKYLIQILTDMLSGSYSNMREICLKTESRKRGCQVMAVLRRYKNENGDWPEGLEEIRSLVSAEVLIDPLNGGDFVYDSNDGDFRLYSRGLDNIDQSAEYNTKLDAGVPSIEVQQDDFVIWPIKDCGTKKKEDADDEAEKSKGQI
jgi:hypothetical protein